MITNKSQINILMRTRVTGTTFIRYALSQKMESQKI